MTPERIENQAQKRQERLQRNRGNKVAKAFARRDALVELGKTVITTETKDEEGNITLHHSFPPSAPVPPSVPSLTFIGTKTYKKSAPSRKNRLRFKVEQTEALVEDASRTLAKEIDKALAPVPQVLDVQMTPEHQAQLDAGAIQVFNPSEVTA